MNYSSPASDDSTHFALFAYSKIGDMYYSSFFRNDIYTNGNIEINTGISTFEGTVQTSSERGALILGKGNSGTSNSILHEDFWCAWKTTTIVCEGANFMSRYNGLYYIVMHEAHRVIGVSPYPDPVDKKQGTIFKTIPTHTTGANGPRECAIDGDNLYVASYNCDIRKFSISTGKLLNIIPISGKADPIHEPFAVSASVSPNPFKNSAVISATFPPHIHFAEIEIFTATGNSLGAFKNQVVNGALSFNIDHALRLA